MEIAEASAPSRRLREATRHEAEKWGRLTEVRVAVTGTERLPVLLPVRALTVPPRARTDGAIRGPNSICGNQSCSPDLREDPTAGIADPPAMGAVDTAVRRVTVLRARRAVHPDTGGVDTAVRRVTVLRVRRAVHPDTGAGDTTVRLVTVLRVPRAAPPATVEDHTALPVPQVVVMGAQEEGTPPVGAAAARVVEEDTRPAGITEVG
jgi:hypothetical protein